MSELVGITQFQGDLKAISEKLGIAVGTAQKKIAFDIFRGVRERSPVDTGRFRANWDMTQGAPSQFIDLMPELKKGAAIAPPPEPDIGEVDGSQPIYVINNLAYATVLEHGSSKQAPAGIVEPTLAATEARADAIINEP